jgi:hypothetical protein
MRRCLSGLSNSKETRTGERSFSQADFLFCLNFNVSYCISSVSLYGKKGKAFPNKCRLRVGTECWASIFTLTFGTIKTAELSAVRAGRILPQVNSLVLISVKRLGGGHMKTSTDPTDFRARDLLSYFMCCFNSILCCSCRGWTTTLTINTNTTTHHIKTKRTSS